MTERVIDVRTLIFPIPPRLPLFPSTRHPLLRNPKNTGSNSTHISEPQILISSGAHLSRYLVQLAMHHHFRSYVPFIKTPWVRSMSTTAFVYLMSVATKRYGNIPTCKGEDDGTIFTEFLRESRYPTEQKHVKWEEVRDILEKYKVSRITKSPTFRTVKFTRRIGPSSSRSATRYFQKLPGREPT